jgi:hypothetical protein
MMRYPLNVINVWQAREYLSMASSFHGYDHAAGLVHRQEAPIFDLMDRSPSEGVGTMSSPEASNELAWGIGAQIEEKQECWHMHRRNGNPFKAGPLVTEDQCRRQAVA